MIALQHKAGTSLCLDEFRASPCRRMVNHGRGQSAVASVEHDKCNTFDAYVELRQGVMHKMTPNYPLLNFDLFATGSLGRCVVAINIVSLERGLQREIPDKDIINGIAGLDRKDHLPVKEAFRRQLKPEIDVLSSQAFGEQETIDFRQEIAPEANRPEAIGVNPSLSSSSAIPL